MEPSPPWLYSAFASFSFLHPCLRMKGFKFWLRCSSGGTDLHNENPGPHIAGVGRQLCRCTSVLPESLSHHWGVLALLGGSPGGSLGGLASGWVWSIYVISPFQEGTRMDSLVDNSNQGMGV